MQSLLDAGADKENEMPYGYDGGTFFLTWQILGPLGTGITELAVHAVDEATERVNNTKNSRSIQRKKAANASGAPETGQSKLNQQFDCEDCVGATTATANSQQQSQLPQSAAVVVKNEIAARKVYMMEEHLQVEKFEAELRLYELASKERTNEPGTPCKD
eukprot:1811101-Pleurochrysis_carterae.AAC.1